MAKYVKIHFREVLESLPSFKARNFETALKDAFHGLDEQMLKRGGTELNNLAGNQYGDEKYTGQAGCTATVVLIADKKVYCANAGDSRTIKSEKKKAIALSDDHKPENPKEMARIKKAGGFVEDNRVDGNLALSRALGDFNLKNQH